MGLCGSSSLNIENEKGTDNGVCETAERIGSDDLFREKQAQSASTSGALDVVPGPHKSVGSDFKKVTSSEHTPEQSSTIDVEFEDDDDDDSSSVGSDVGDWLDEDDSNTKLPASRPGTESSRKKMKKRVSSRELSYITHFPKKLRTQNLRHLSRETFSTGDVIVRQGADGDKMFVIVDGEAAVTKDDDDGSRRLVTHLYRGDYFGETSMIYGVKRTATVTAVKPLDTYVMTREIYLNMPRVRSYVSLSKCDVTKDLDMDQKMNLCDHLRAVEFSRGEYVMREGDCVTADEPAFFMITMGEVEVSDSIRGHLVNLRVGHFFGEMALVNEAPRNASVKVVSKILTCMALCKPDFDRCVMIRDKIVENTRHLEVVRETRRQLDAVGNGLKRRGSERSDADHSSTIDATEPRVADIKSIERFRSKSIDFVPVVRPLSPRRWGRHHVNDYRIIRMLGKGSFAEVKLVQHVTSEKRFAMKCMKRGRLRRMRRSGSLRKSDMMGETELDAELMTEVKIMKLMEHPHIVDLHEVIDDTKNDRLYLIQELCEGGTIMPELETETGSKPLSLSMSRLYTRQIICALEYMHYCRVIHRDLKPQNILVNLARDHIKICDFGTACLIADGETLTVPKGTPAFMAPEILLDETVQYTGPAADVWSLGATLYCMVVGRQPWLARDYTTLSEKVRHDELTFPKHVTLTPHLRDLITRILTKDPKRRPVLSVVMRHEWITAEGSDPMKRTGGKFHKGLVIT